MSQLIPVAFLAALFAIVIQFLPDDLGEEPSTHHCDPWCDVALEPVRADYDPLRVVLKPDPEKPAPVARPVQEHSDPAPAARAVIVADSVPPRALIVAEPASSPRIPRAVVIEEPAAFASLAR